MDEIDLPQRRRRGIYLLPNLFTTGTLFGGFYAIVAAMTKDDFSGAAIAIVGAMICDSLDGLVARKTNTASDFGKEYDSLCDMVAFGVAASLVMYIFCLQYLAGYKWLGGELGKVTAFAFTACAALRLARFNVLAARGEAKGNFFGLPSPAAAAVVVGFVWAANVLGINGKDPLVVISATVLTWGVAVLMVTNISFLSLKTIKLTERVPFRYIVFVIGLLALFWTKPSLIFFLVFLGYALSGPIMVIYRRTRKPAVAVPAEREPPSV